ncbi:MAG: ComEC/Rec2 family competence protein, partial [Bryobacteraceae bacterium]
MKLPSLWPAALFAGGILLSGTRAGLEHLAPVYFVITPALALLLALILLRFDWIRAAAVLGSLAWVLLGLAAAKLEAIDVPHNLISSLIESGKLDSAVPLRWRGRLRADPQRLPWGTRYEISLDQVGSSAGDTPVTGGLRLTLYRDEGQIVAPPAGRAGDRVEAFVHAVTIRNFGNPGNFDNRAFLGRQGIQLLATLRNPQLLAVLDDSHVTMWDRLARARGDLLASLDSLLGDRPQEAALARAMLLGDRSFVEQDRIDEFQRTGVYHVLVLAGLHVGALVFFFEWVGRRLRLSLLPRTVLTLAALAAYTGIVEDRPPILRAALMAAIFLSARLLYRRTDLLNVTALAALGILVVRPSEITDASFLLSISAVAIIGALAVPGLANSSEPYRKG